MNNKTVAVVGAGIVGVSCALWLQKKGFSVVLIDPEKPGSGTSSGNACTIADYACVPINSPSLFMQLPGLMLSRNGPLSVDLWYAFKHMPWMLHFLKFCTPAKVRRITRIMHKLLQKTYEGLTPLIAMTESVHLLEKRGCMYVYKNQREYRNAQAATQVRRDHGIEFTELDAGAIRELEPGIKMPFVKGYLFENASQVLNPQSLTTRFFDYFIAHQGRYVDQTAVAVRQESETVRVFLGNGEALDVDRVVIAAGAFSKAIQGTGAHILPLDTERGYHVQYTGMQSLVTRPVSWNEAGFYATPMDQGLRIAGTVEIGGTTEQRNPRVLNYLKRRAEEMFDLEDQPHTEWLGFRPTLPDALPAIGYSPQSEYILYAFGHHHLGLTLAGITGKLIAELICGEKPSHNIKPFSPGRFR